MKHVSRAIIVALILIGPLLLLTASRTNAGTSAASEFDAAWERYDRAVVDGVGDRSWTFGPAPFTGVREIPADENMDALRAVQYYDKGRIEETLATDLTSEGDSVRFGNLVSDLVTGRALLDDGMHYDMAPSNASVAGDADDPGGLRYTIISMLLDSAPQEDGATLIDRVTSEGIVTSDATLDEYDVTAGLLIEEAHHRMASVFEDFLWSNGAVWMDDSYENAPVFPEPLFATGVPLTEAYWVRVAVDGVPHDVLLQCFEKRCLTYTPSNPAGWQVESNNVGNHYYEWLDDQPASPDPTASPEIPDSGVLPIGIFETEAGEMQSMALEVAATDPTRACGLMHRESMDEDTGMLFVWESDHAGAFWNCNTYIPLTLAWISAEGEILGLTDMANQTPGEPQDVVSYPPPSMYRYVIEANRGWFGDHGIGVGGYVDLAEALARGDTGGNTLCMELGLVCR